LGSRLDAVFCGPPGAAGAGGAVTSVECVLWLTGV